MDAIVRAVISLYTATTAERFFRIDRAQEHLHYITDISSEDLYILDPEIHASFMQNDPQAAAAGDQDSTDGKVTTLAPPAAVIVHDTDMKECVNGHGQSLEVKYTFSLPVTPPKSPGWEFNVISGVCPGMALFYVVM